MSNDSKPTKLEGTSAPKAPPPLPRRTQTSAPARTSQTVSQAEAVRVASGEQERKGVVEAIRRKLPSFKYQSTARLSQPNVQLNSIAAAIQKRLPGCHVTTDETGAIVVKNIDRFLNLGVLDTWILFNWLFRDVNARITLSKQDKFPMVVADIEQEPSFIFAISALISVPLLLVGLANFGCAIVFYYRAKGIIQSAVQQLLTDVAKGVT